MIKHISFHTHLFQNLENIFGRVKITAADSSLRSLSVAGKYLLVQARQLLAGRIAQKKEPSTYK